MTEANDAICRQTSKGRDGRPVDVAGIKPQRSTADEHDARDNAKAAGVKSERIRRHNDNECFACGTQEDKQWDCPQSQRSRVGKGVHGQSHGQPPHNSSSPQTVPVSIPGARQRGWPLCLPSRELVLTRPFQTLWSRKSNLMCLNHLRRMTTTTCTFACRGKRRHSSGLWAHRDSAARLRFVVSPGLKNTFRDTQTQLQCIILL